MQLKGRAAIIGGIFMLAAAVSIFVLRDKITTLINGKAGATDTLVTIEALTPQIAAISQQIKQAPANPQLYLQRGDAYFNYGNLKYALLDYKHAYSLDSTTAAYAIGLADCYFEVNYADSAILILERYLQHDPKNIDALLDVAQDYFLLPTPKYELALARLDDILKIDIQNSEAYFYRGLILKETGDTVKAIRSFQTAAETNPDYYDAYMQIGLLYADKNDPLAVKYFDNAIALNDSSNEAKYAKAKFLQDNGKLHEAISYYTKIIEKDPQDADAIYNLASIYYGVDSMERAYRLFDISIKQNPSKPEAYFGKALCAEELGKTEEAISFYEQALNLNPDYKDAEEQLNKLKAKQQ